MLQAIELFSGLFTDPKATLYKAREAEYTLGVLAVGLAGIGVSAMVGAAKVGFLAAAIGSALVLVVTAGAVWIGGTLTGGTGSLVDIMKLCAVVWLPVSLVHGVFAAVSLGFIGSLFGLVVWYYLILVGHNFYSPQDVVLAYVFTIIFGYAGSTLAVGAVLGTLML